MMIEEIILGYLSKSLDVPAYMEEPEKPPKEYLLIDKIGSSESNMIQSAVIAVQSYGEGLYRSALLNAEVKELMRDSVVLDSVSRCRLNSDYNYTDTETKRYRYQAVFDIVYYE